MPISPEWRAAELDYLIGHSEICVAASIPERAAALTRRGPQLRSAARRHRSRRPRRSRPLPHSRRDPGSPNADSECALLYTSGHHRPAEGLRAAERVLSCAPARWYTQVGGLCEVRPGIERMLTPLPMMHMNAMAFSTMCMILSGGCLVLLDRFHPRTWWQSVRQSRATIVHYLGVMPAILLADAPTPRGPSTTACASASAPVSTRATMRPSRRASAFRCSRPGR